MKIRVQVEAHGAHLVFKDLLDIPSHLINLITSAAATVTSSHSNPVTLRLTFRYRSLWWSRTPCDQTFKYHLVLETYDKNLLNLRGKYRVLSEKAIQ